MTPLHILTMNPHAPADSIAALLASNMETILCLDNQEKNPLDYPRDYNFGDLVGVIVGLCNHRNSSIYDETDSIQVHENAAKRMRIEY